MHTAEHLFYNATAILCRGSYASLKKLSAAHPTWEQAYAHIAPPRHDPEILLRALEARHISLILRNDSLFPKLLREIPHPPFGIYVRGILPMCSSFSHAPVAIVGTRKSTEHARISAGNFAVALGHHSVSVISGLALGIDAAAHAGALSLGIATYAVVGHGLDITYPSAHRRLADNIINDGGAIISEYPLGTDCMPYRFLERNRIVSGLSRAVVVIEAPEKSGALATARFALEQNRDVFVVPGPTHHSHYRGSHQLIRSGATLVRDPHDLLDDLGISSNSPSSPTPPQTVGCATLEESLIFTTISNAFDPIPLDKICEITKLSIHTVTSIITTLLLSYAIIETETGYIASNSRHR
ncbi:MAG: hypothetical protein RIQ54_148 [Candidatus Parcubacteria bacterium]|jgi:DNA processing protein